MKVMYTCDNNYVWLMGISTISLFENNKGIKDLKVYLLGENISEDNKKDRASPLRFCPLEHNRIPSHSLSTFPLPRDTCHENKKSFIILKLHFI